MGDASLYNLSSEYNNTSSVPMSSRAWYGIWKTIFPYSILVFLLPYSISSMFHIEKFSSIFYFVLPHQDKFRPEAPERDTASKLVLLKK